MLRTGDYKVQNEASVFWIGGEKNLCNVNGERDCGVLMWVRVKTVSSSVVVVVVVVVVR
jgi:hypothetical protein